MNKKLDKLKNLINILKEDKPQLEKLKNLESSAETTKVNNDTRNSLEQVIQEQ